jgi:hypothetical protein
VEPKVLKELQDIQEHKVRVEQQVHKELRVPQVTLELKGL